MRLIIVAAALLCIACARAVADRTVSVRVPVTVGQLAPGARVDVLAGDEVLLRDVEVAAGPSRTIEIIRGSRTPGGDDDERWYLLGVWVTRADSLKVAAARASGSVVARPR